MPKLEQILFLEPYPELHFTGPFNEVSLSKFSMANPTQTPVCFKIKTKAPKIYSVHPNRGVVGPFETVDVSVTLQPVGRKNFGDDKRNHKVVIQSMFAPMNNVDCDTVWQEAFREDIMKSKLRCILFFPFEDLELVDFEDQEKDKEEDEAVDQEEYEEVDQVEDEAEDEVAESGENGRTYRIFSPMEEGLHMRLTHSTLELLGAQNTNEKKKEEKSTVLLKPYFLLLCAAMMFLLGFVAGRYLI